MTELRQYGCANDCGGLSEHPDAMCPACQARAKLERLAGWFVPSGAVVDWPRPVEDVHLPEGDAVNDAIFWNFTETCQTCGETVQYTAGQRQPHPCPENPAIVIEGCGGTDDLATRVERALDDADLLRAAGLPEGETP